MAYPVHMGMIGNPGWGMEYFLKLYPRKTRGKKTASHRSRSNRRKAKR